MVNSSKTLSTLIGSTSCLLLSQVAYAETDCSRDINEMTFEEYGFCKSQALGDRRTQGFRTGKVELSTIVGETSSGGAPETSLPTERGAGEVPSVPSPSTFSETTALPGTGLNQILSDTPKSVDMPSEPVLAMPKDVERDKTESSFQGLLSPAPKATRSDIAPTVEAERPVQQAAARTVPQPAETRVERPTRRSMELPSEIQSEAMSVVEKTPEVGSPSPFAGLAGPSPMEPSGRVGSATSQGASGGQSVRSEGFTYPVGYELPRGFETSVFFDTNSARVLGTSNSALTEVRDALLKNSEWKIRIVGHASADGDSAMNWELSRVRAWSVYQALVSLGVAEERMSYEGFGAFVLRDTLNPTSDINRRVEIIVE